jgi:hypothetical protein
MAIWSYPKIYNVGHLEVARIFDYPVVVQEKVDGSQFSFMVEERDDGWHHYFRSKGAEIDYGNPQALFRPAVEWVLEHESEVQHGVVYRGEAMCKPKHNTLVYGRAPEAGFILFDIERGEQDFLDWRDARAEALRLGVEFVPTIEYPAGTFTSDHAAQWLDRESVLGKSKVEGFVIKAYGQYDRFNKTQMAKHVSEAFKEVHQGDWKKRNPDRKDIVAQIVNDFGGPARWQKAVQHLRDSGELVNAPQDIGPLIKELATDLKAEQEEAIKATLFKFFWPTIQRGISKGFPEWYKASLLERQFDDSTD